MEKMDAYCPLCGESIFLNDIFCSNVNCKANIRDCLNDLYNPFIHRSFLSKTYNVILKCPKCSIYIQTSHYYCMECGKKIDHLKDLKKIPQYKTCPNCDLLNKIEENFCTECGKPFVDFLHSLKKKQIVQNPDKIMEYRKINFIKDQVQNKGQVELEELRVSFEMDRELFYSRIFDWVEKIGLKIENRCVVINHNQVNRFLDQLDYQFLDWQKVDKNKCTKLL